MILHILLGFILGILFMDWAAKHGVILYWDDADDWM